MFCDFQYRGIQWAIKNKSLEEMECVLNKGIDVEDLNKYKRTPLHDAIHLGSVAGVKLLLEQGVDVNVMDETGKTALHKAIESYNEDIVNMLLDKGAEIDAGDKDGRTPLYIAVISMLEPAVSLLLQRGARLDLEDGMGIPFWKTLLEYTVNEKNENIFLLLAQKVLEIEDCKNVLHLAVKGNFQSAIDFLLTSKCDVNSKSDENETALHTAVREGRISFTGILVRKGANVNDQDGSGNTPLHLGVLEHDLQSVEILVTNGAQLEIKNSNGQTALHSAVIDTRFGPKSTIRDEIAIIKLLLQKGADINAKDKSNQTPLHVAANNVVLVSKLLLDRRANLKETRKKQTPLHVSVDSYESQGKCELFFTYNAEANSRDRDGNGPNSSPFPSNNYSFEEKLLFVKQLMDNRDNVNNFNENDVTPFHLAWMWCDNIDDKDVTTSSLFIDKVSDINISDDSGNYPLHKAIMKGNEKQVEILLEKGAEVNVKNKDGNTPLHFAAAFYPRDNVEKLLANGAEVNAKNKNDDTPLNFAIINGLNNYVQKLLDFNANLNIKNKNGQTALHIASMNASSEVVRTLLIRGAEVNVKDYGSKTPLHYASMNKNEEILSSILYSGAEVTVKDNDLKTPLHYASKNRLKRPVTHLLHKGAEVNVEDIYGNTPLHYACKSDHKTLVESLLLKDADVNVKNKLGQTPLHLAAAFQQYNNYGGELDFIENFNVIETLLEWGASISTLDGFGKTPVDWLIGFSKRLCMDVLKEYLIKLKCIDFYPFTHFDIEKNIDYHYEAGKFDSHELSCAEESIKLKTFTVDQHSLYNVFSKFNDPTFLLNGKMELGLKSFPLDDEFPIYASLLNATLVRAKRRLILLDEAQDSLNITLPREVIRKILSYLDKEDLKNVIKTNEEVRKRFKDH